MYFSGLKKQKKREEGKWIDKLQTSFSFFFFLECRAKESPFWDNVRKKFRKKENESSLSVA